VKDAELIGNINEIIGINTGAKKENDESAKPSGKTSIMTTSTGKTLKRKHEDDVVKIDADDVEDAVPDKKFASEKMVVEPKSEITITAIPKVSEEKTIEKEPEVQVTAVV
jgi:hypothetical protein